MSFSISCLGFGHGFGHNLSMTHPRCTSLISSCPSNTPSIDMMCPIGHGLKTGGKGRQGKNNGWFWSSNLWCVGAPLVWPHWHPTYGPCWSLKPRPYIKWKDWNFNVARSNDHNGATSFNPIIKPIRPNTSYLVGPWSITRACKISSGFTSSMLVV